MAHAEEPFEWYAVTREKDVRALLHDWKTWTSELGPGLARTGGGVLVSVDPPEHTFDRRLVNRAFTPSSLLGMEPRITELIGGIIDGFAERGEGDYMQLPPCAPARRPVPRWWDHPRWATRSAASDPPPPPGRILRLLPRRIPRLPCLHLRVEAPALAVRPRPDGPHGGADDRGLAVAAVRHDPDVDRHGLRRAPLLARGLRGTSGWPRMRQPPPRTSRESPARTCRAERSRPRTPPDRRAAGPRRGRGRGCSPRREAGSRG